MAGQGGVSAWLLMTVGEDRQHRGNAGYEDQPDVYYTWDSTVPNHALIKSGDPIAIWDTERLLGVSVIEEIERSVKEKVLFKCPRCLRAGIKARQKKSPTYKCYQCGEAFDTPQTKVVTVTEYRSRHDAAWTSLENLLPGTELRALCESPRSQLSMRPLRWSAFEGAIASKGADRAVQRVLHRATDVSFPRGHTLEFVRVRRGQRQFRDHLLEQQGQTCAFTGDAPTRVLEAGHLYSYAALGVHHQHGGLLLRRDIHRLFDDGWLAVDPGTLSVDVAPTLERFPQYATLHDRPLQVQLRDPQIEWLERHWTEHRAS